jgi:signal transduction histidine kinase
MSPIHEAVDGVVPKYPGHARSSSGLAQADVQLIQQLHDGPTQWMALALLQLDRTLGAGCVADAHLLNNVRTLLGEALRSIRHVLDDRCGSEPVAAMSLGAALSQLGHRLAALTALTLRLECDERVVDPPVPVTAMVLHAVQELLLNTCKHAPGAEAEVVLAAADAGFELSVCDDGPGFEPTALCRRHSIAGGLGLGTLPERLAGVGVGFRVRSRPGAGVQARICWPARPDGPRRGLLRMAGP